VILLDTNVVSELMRPQPNATVFAWVARQPRRDVYTTSISKAEIRYGIALLPEGRRKTAFAADAERMFRDDFADTLLPFDAAAAVHYAEIRSMRRRAGRPMTPLDAQIAAIALAVGAAVATRNVADFAGCGIAVIDPWSHDS
jgi:predicted nucleic acid-binding protein